MKKNYPGILALGIIMVIVLGCGGLKNMLPKKGQYFEGDAAKTAADAIKEEIGKPFGVVEIFIDADTFRVQAVDPNNPRNVDEYKYAAGFVAGPTPVQLSGMIKDPEKSSFPFDEIDFSAIPKF